MGFFSNLFGRNEAQKALNEVFGKIRRILEDEKYQLEVIHPLMRAEIMTRPAYDRDPAGTGPFGLAHTNPIPVNGPIGELAYLSRLQTEKGDRLLFHRIGAIGVIDVFEAVAFSRNEWFILFLDLYHPRKSTLAPEGFGFTKELGQFSGFNQFCPQFPYDFVERKHALEDAGLRLAYIAISKIDEQLQSRVFERPLGHKVKLDLLKGQLTSLLS